MTLTNKYLLSICIPTLNRSKYLKGVLENLLSEIERCKNPDEIQIVIVDGNSNDDTEEVANTFEIKCALKYFRREKKVGVDKDIMKCVELADGKYCWLFSDDDLFVDGAVQYLLDILRSEEPLSGCFCNRIPHDFKMERMVAEVNEWPGKVFNDNQLFLRKSDCIRNIGMDYGFLSSQVVNRSIWLKAFGSGDFGDLYKSYYLMVHIIFKMQNENCRWMYIHRPMLKQRTGNDTLLNNEGVIKRQKVEHENFEKILNLHYDRNSDEQFVFFKKLVKRIPRALANMKAQGISFPVQLSLFKLFYKKYKSYSRFWYLVVPIFFIPNILLMYVKKFYFRFLV